MDSKQSFESILTQVISCLEDLYGDLEWWPGNTDEVLIGAILTQQTRWENVLKALLNLEDLGIRTIADVHNADEEMIMEAVRCTGFYRLKTGRLKELASFVDEYGGIDSMRRIPKENLRKDLLGVKGIGAETADSILCYGFDMTSYVIDSYTERITGCTGITLKKEELRRLFEKVLPESVDTYKSCHGRFVEYAKDYCVKKRCDECKIRNLSR